MRPKLYRFYDEDGDLIYVGVSLSIINRLKHHKANSHWFDRVAKITIENFNTEEEMLKAEKNVIVEENPFFNKKFSKRKREFNKHDSLTLFDISNYLNIKEGRIQQHLVRGKFMLKPETEKPYTWIKWKIDLHLMKPEIIKYIEELRNA